MLLSTFLKISQKFLGIQKDQDDFVEKSQKVKQITKSKLTFPQSKMVCETTPSS